MPFKNIARLNVKMMLAPLLYRHWPIGLQPPRFYLWLDALYKTRHLSGSVVEVGVAVGGTSAFAANFLRQINSTRQYICIDTFSGFSKDQFAEDVKLGNSWKKFSTFSANSQSLVRKVLRMHGAEDVKLIRGDISKLDKAMLPTRISACLLDVDLAIPIYDGLKLLWPLLETDGVIVVDDCYENNTSDWQALTGYRKFCKEMKLDQQFFCGAAYLVKGKALADAFPSYTNSEHRGDVSAEL